MIVLSQAAQSQSPLSAFKEVGEQLKHEMIFDSLLMTDRSLRGTSCKF